MHQGSVLVCRLSILVPWWNEARSFEDTLVSILENRPQNAEILVIHSHRYDDPYDLRREVRFVQCAAESELELINTGIYRAAGDIVHVIRCGLLATRHWTDSVVTQFEPPSVAAVAPTIVAADGTRMSGWRLSRSGKLCRLTSNGTTDSSSPCTAPSMDAGFYRRQPVLDLGGFNLGMAGVAELDLGLALADLDLQCVTNNDSELITSVEPTCFVDASQIAKALEILYWRTRKKPTQLGVDLSHLLTVAGELMRGRFSTFFGRVRGWRKGEHQSYRDRITDVRERMRDRAGEDAQRTHREDRQHRAA
jgi:hypothetical protein